MITGICRLPIDLRNGILCAGLRTTSDKALIELAQKKLDDKTIEKDEKADILAGLGCITSEEFINQFLNSTLETDLFLDALNSVVTGNAASFDVLIQFITENIGKIQNA